MKTDLRTPLGPDVKDVDLRYLEAIVLSKGEEYWNHPRGSGDATLTQSIGGQEQSLSLTYKAPYGFLLSHYQLGEIDPYVATISDDWTETTDVLLGGEPWTIPKAFLVDRATAWLVVKHFFQTGERLDTLKWIDLNRSWP